VGVYVACGQKHRGSRP